MGRINPNLVYKSLPHDYSLLLIEITLPTVDNYLSILLDNRLYHGDFIFLEPMIVDLRYLGDNVILRFLSILDHMNVYWFVIIGIEFEYESK